MRFREINLDETRMLRFTVNAMRELEEQYGGGLQNVFNEKNVGFKQLTTLLRVALKHGGNPRSWTAQLSDEKVGEMIQEHWIDADKPMNDLYTLVLETMNASGFLGKGDEKAPKEDMSKRRNLPPA